MNEPMILRARAAAPHAVVRAALTDADALRVWLAEYAEVDLPHHYTFWGRYTPAGDAPRQRLLHTDDHTLRFAWQLDGRDTTVEFALREQAPDSTIVTLTQTGLPDYAEMLAEATRLGYAEADPTADVEGYDALPSEVVGGLGSAYRLQG